MADDSNQKVVEVVVWNPMGDAITRPAALEKVTVDFDNERALANLIREIAPEMAGRPAAGRGPGGGGDRPRLVAHLGCPDRRRAWPSPSSTSASFLRRTRSCERRAWRRTWPRDGRAEDLASTLHAALPVAAAHHAVSYQRILDGVESTNFSEWGPVVGSFLDRMHRLL